MSNKVDNCLEFEESRRSMCICLLPAAGLPIAPTHLLAITAAPIPSWAPPIFAPGQWTNLPNVAGCTLTDSDGSRSAAGRLLTVGANNGACVWPAGVRADIVLPASAFVGAVLMAPIVGFTVSVKVIADVFTKRDVVLSGTSAVVIPGLKRFAILGGKWFRHYTPFIILTVSRPIFLFMPF